MKALFFDGNSLRLVDRAKPAPGPGETLLRVILAGICGTDLEILEGYMRFVGVPGHEFVGLVERCDDPCLLGQRVVGEINCGCRVCAWCRKGDPRHCPDRMVLGIKGRDGAFAEHTCLPTGNLHRIPEELPDEAAVLVEPLAACFEILEQAHLGPTHNVVILGDGRLAQLAARVLRLTGSRMLVVGKHPEKLELLENLGLHCELVSDFKPKPIADIVVEATGAPSGFLLAMESVTPRGVVVLKSTYKKRPEVDLARVVVDEVTVLGSRCGRFEPAIRALKSGTVPVDDLIGPTYPLSDWEEAFTAARSGALKVLLRMSQPASC